MRRLSLLSLLVLLLAACGGGDNSAGNSSATGSTDMSDPGEEAWLIVEARGDRENFDWYIDDQEVDAEGLKEAMQSYGDKTDKQAGLEGRDANGISANPVLFTAAPGVTSQAFLAALETLAGAMMHRMRIELAPVDGTPMRQWLQLPVDQGFGGPVPAKLFLTPWRTGDLLQLAVAYEGSRESGMGGIIEEDSGETAAPPPAKKPLNAGIMTTDLFAGGFDAQVYETTRKAMLNALREFHEESGADAKAVEIAAVASTLPRTDEYPRWGTLYLQIDAVNRANIGHTTFKFTDALERYRDG